MKTVFLDLDGVLNFWGWHEPDLAKYQDYWTGRCLEPCCVEAFNAFIVEVRAKIVISSSWRIRPEYDGNLPALVAALREGGVQGDIIDVTPRLFTERQAEILDWLNEHPEVTHYVAFDDDCFDMLKLGSHFVEVDHKTGFTTETAKLGKKALEIPR